MPDGSHDTTKAQRSIVVTGFTNSVLDPNAPMLGPVENGGTIINAGYGDDVIYDSNGNDRVYGGGGKDRLGESEIATGNDSLFGGVDNDSLFGGRGNDLRRIVDEIVTDGPSIELRVTVAVETTSKGTSCGTGETKSQ